VRMTSSAVSRGMLPTSNNAPVMTPSQAVVGRSPAYWATQVSVAAHPDHAVVSRVHSGTSPSSLLTLLTSGGVDTMRLRTRAPYFPGVGTVKLDGLENHARQDDHDYGELVGVGGSRDGIAERTDQRRIDAPQPLGPSSAAPNTRPGEAERALRV
jgi:hypothetical protein